MFNPIKVSLKQRNGWWHFRYCISRKEIRKSIGTKDKNIAEQRRIEQEYRLNTEDPILFKRIEKIFFKDFIHVFFDVHAKEHFSPDFCYASKRRCSIINGYIGDKLLNEITPNEIRETLKKIKTYRTLQNSSVNRYRTLLNKMFNFAKESGYSDYNPVKDVKKYKETNKSKDFNYLEDQELQTFFSSCDNEFYPIATTLVYTGIRISELCGLLWENVNFNKGFLTISNSLSGPTKDLESRIIHMNEHLFEILQKQRSISNGSKYVFPKNNGNMRGRNFTKRFRSTLKRAGINKHLVVHDLRHTFATQYAKTGSIYTLKEFMWHSDIKTTER